MSQKIHDMLKSSIRKLQERYFIKLSGMASLAFSTALAAVFEYFGGHEVIELPDHLDRAFAFVVHIGGLAQVGEWEREAVQRLLLACEDQNAIAPTRVVDQVLACLA